MLTFWDRKQTKFCDGITRRGFLKVGALDALSLADVLRLQAQPGNSAKPHKAVIVICLQGGPSHIDMYDMKPDAPAEYRGEFRPIRTNVPGFDRAHSQNGASCHQLQHLDSTKVMESAF